MDRPAKEDGLSERPEDFRTSMQANAQEPDTNREPAMNNRKGANSASKSLSGKLRSWIPEKRRHRWLLLISLIIIGLGIWEIWRYFAVRESTDDAKVDGYIIPVSARIMGTVAAVNVEDFQYVKAGTILVQLDPTDYKMALAHAQADLAAAQANASAARSNDLASKPCRVATLATPSLQ